MAQQEDLFSGPEQGPGSSTYSVEPAYSRALPFGKYKGQPYEVLLNDSTYALWLLSSMYAKLELNHPKLLAFLVGRYGQPDRTPAHNVLQNRFLDETFCYQFALASSSEVRAIAETLSRTSLPLEEIWRARVSAEYQRELRVSGMDEDDETVEKNLERLEALRPLLVEEAALLQLYGPDKRPRDPNSACKGSALSYLEFESQGADVTYLVSLDYRLFATRHPSRVASCTVRDVLASLTVSRLFRIEVKPVMGDDYPAVLRAMKAANNSSLLVGEYNGAGASWDQVVKVFSLSKISVVQLCDVELVEVPKSLELLNVKPMTTERAHVIVEEEFTASVQHLHKLIADSAARRRRFIQPQSTSR